jgi:general stress protein 26
MRETAEDLERLQALLDASHASRGIHISEIITDERRLTAGELAERLTGMRLLVLATTTADGRPLVSPVDGFFYRGEFWFGSAPKALKIRHIEQRPAVSATYLEGEKLSVTVHGEAHIEGTPEDLKDTGFGEVAAEFYGATWHEWGSGAVYARIAAHKMFVFHMEPNDQG